MDMKKASETRLEEIMVAPRGAEYDLYDRLEGYGVCKFVFSKPNK